MKTIRPEPLHLTHPGFARMLGLAVLSLVMAAFCVWMLCAADATKHFVVGVLGSVFFGGAFILLLFRLRLAGTDMYVLDEEGVHFTDTRYKMIPWSAVEGVEPFTVRNQRFLGLHLRDEKARVDALPTPLRLLAMANKKIGCPAFCLTIQDDEALARSVEICAYWLRQG